MKTAGSSASRSRAEIPGGRPARPVGGGPRADRGQGLVEYGLILSLGALVALVALAVFGDALAAALNLIGQVIDSAR